MAEVRKNIILKIQALDWRYDNNMISAEEYNARLDYLLDRLEKCGGAGK